MSHEAMREKLLDLAYGELAPREARKVEAHAASCEACRVELANLRGTRRTMSALADEPAPERGERILLAAARERAEAPRRRRLVPGWLWGTAAAAFSLVAVAAVSYRILALRPGPLSGRGDELLGSGPYASAPPAPAEAPAWKGAPESAGPRSGFERGKDDARDRAAAGALEQAERHSGAEGAEAAPARRRKGHSAERSGGAADEPPPRYAQAPPPASRDSSLSRGEAAEVDPDDAGRGARAEPPPPSPAPSARAARAPETSDAPAAEAPAAGEVAAADAEPLRPPPRMDAPTRSAPARSRAEAAPSAAASRAAAAPRAPQAAPPTAALERWQALRDAGALREEVREFAGCEGEALRRVESDPDGRLVRYVREGRVGGRRLRVEHVYAADGRLAVATVRDLDAPGVALDADALGLALPADAAAASLEAPPRCGR